VSNGLVGLPRQGFSRRKTVDRFQCEKCSDFFYFDLELEGMAAEPDEKLALACPICLHPWSIYRPENPEREQPLH
jgi:hypothetical protein